MSARTLALLSDVSVLVGLTSVQVLPSVPAQVVQVIGFQNNGPNTCAVNLTGGTAALNSAGSLMMAMTNTPIFLEEAVPINAVSAISAGLSNLTIYYMGPAPPVPSFVLSGAAIDMFFKNGTYYGNPAPSCSRGSNGTDLLPVSASGASFITFTSGVLRITNGKGLLVEEPRTNFLLNSTAPVTQTTGSLGTGTYTLWVNGSGSATPSAGTATITGAAAATNGSPNTFTVTVAGTVVVTVAGSLNAFQLENGPFGTSLIVTAGATANRSADFDLLASPPTFGVANTTMMQGTGYSTNTYGFNTFVGGPSDGSTNNEAVLGRLAVTASAVVIMAGGGVTGGPTGVTLWSQGVSGKMAIAQQPGDQSLVFNGGTPATANSAITLSGMNRVSLGCAETAAGYWNGYVERLVIWPTTRLPDATLQSITT